MGDATPEPENGALVRRFHAELFAAGDIGAVDEFFSPHFVSHSMPPGLPPGVEGVKRFFTIFREGLPDVEVAIDELLADRDKVAVATTISGTHEGELMGVAPTGRRVAVAGIDLLRIEDGRFVEHRGLTDTVGLLRQLS
jgi:predicted ester cyclase